MEHYIELIDGTRIEAFPKAVQPETIKEDKFVLDTTGEYLQVGSRKRMPKRTTERDIIAQQRGELLCRNLHRLIAESDKILADSKMFLAPVPIHNGLAYFGTSGFQTPTLGVYIEWWRHHKCAWVIDELGERQPLIYIAGSPISGANKCAYVGAEGMSYGVSVTNFAPVWQSFMNVNTRYTKAKQRYDAYTLEEVVEILFS